MIFLSLELIVSLLQDCFFKASTISLLNSIKTCSTTSIVSFPVTRSPLINSLFIPNSFNLLFILLPPPWTTIGIKPSLFSVVMSFINMLNKFWSTRTLPPHFITIYSSLYFSRYLFTSSIEGPSDGRIFLTLLLWLPALSSCFNSGSFHDEHLLSHR